MEQLVGHFVELFSTHFDLSFMLCVNVLTYILIKAIDDINNDSKTDNPKEAIALRVF